MCGFVASFSPEPGRALGLERVRRMCDLMSHRGPDHFGTYVDPYVTLGHRRLSIIDLSDAANQPFTKEHLTLVYNGEIYNYVELTRELEGDHGARFRTRSDVEVIVEAYDKWGETCVDRFNGMFSFALWNARDRTLFVARDRLGVKPLFVLRQDGTYLFASDLKAFWNVRDPASHINPGAIHHYFGQGFISTGETSTRGVVRVPAGQAWTLSAGDERSRTYWDLNAVRPDPALRFPDAVERTEQLFDDALRIRLRSDVPLGCFLSGGVDSSLVVARTAQSLGSSFHTYSIGFDSEAHDETPYIDRVLARYPTQHHHRRLDSSCLDALPAIVWKYSELFGDASAVPTYFVSQAAREGLTVVLTGDGGDEAFGGYVDPFARYVADKYQHVPAPVRRAISRLLALPERVAPAGFWRRMRRFDDIAGCSAEEAYLRFTGSTWFARPDAFVDPAGAAASRSLEGLRGCARSGDVDRLLYTDIVERLGHDFLVKVDMATMAHSLEARSPYLDYRMIELGYSLDHTVRYHGYERKAVLKAVARRHVDPVVVDRRKMGFSMPQAIWLREPRWAPVVRAVIERRSLLDEFLSRTAIEESLAAFEAGDTREANRIWLLLWFQVWEGLVVSRRYDPTQPLTAVHEA